MIDWELEDLSPGKKKGILRQILEEGSSGTTPNDGAQVTGELNSIINHVYIECGNKMKHSTNLF